MQTEHELNDTKVDRDHPSSGTEKTVAGWRTRAREGMDAVEGKLRDLGGGVAWKSVAGVAIGIVLVAGVLLIASRRARSVSLLQRGLREGSKYAVLIPMGLHKARSSADHLARGVANQWDKLPRIHVEVK
jgi:hypothetical protein